MFTRNKIFIFLAGFVLWALLSCNERPPDSESDLKTAIHDTVSISPPSVPDTNYVVLGHDSLLLTEAMIKEIDSLFWDYAHENYLQLLEPERYKRQYFPSKNKDGEIGAFVNCFCSHGENWKHYQVTVLDGGKCYFHYNVNLKTRKIWNVMINGEA